MLERGDPERATTGSKDGSPTWFAAGISLVGLIAACTASAPRARPVEEPSASPPVASSETVTQPTAGPTTRIEPARASLQPATPAGPRHVDAEQLRALVEVAADNGSDALLVEHRGELLIDEQRQPGALIETMSITKSVLSLAVGIAVDRGKLRLEQPLSDFFVLPAGSSHAGIRLHHLLSHTSGMENPLTTAVIRRASGVVADALSARLTSEPGVQFDYSNRGANLVSAILQKAVGAPADEFAAREIFTPLGITRYKWRRDRRGVAYGMDGLELSPSGLLALGRLVAARGKHDGKQIVSEAWLQRSTGVAGQVGPAHRRAALFWWLLPRWVKVSIDDSVLAAWRDAGVPESFVARTTPLHHRTFARYDLLEDELEHIFGKDLTEWHETTWKRDVEDVAFQFGETVGTQALGTAGQYLVVLPDEELVAVRLAVVRSLRDRDDDVRRFPDFPQRVVDLLYAGDPAPTRP